MNMTRRIVHTTARMLLCSAVAAGLTAGCSETIHTRGNFPDPKVIAQIKPGKQTRGEITRLLGTPSTIARYEQETWLYIGGRVKSKSFFKPEVLERRVLGIQFDKRGIVKEVQTHDASKAKTVELVDRETPTKGKELTFLQQLVGNVGRFADREEKDTGGGL